MSGKYVYMKVSKDKYRIPEVVADSLKELAEKCGTTSGSIASYISHAKKQGKEIKYIKVKIKD